MLRILRSGSDDIKAILNRRSIPLDETTEQIVKATIADVAERGDAALLDSARKYDAPNLESIHVHEDSIRQAPKFEALQTAANRIRAFHDEQARRLQDARQWSQHGVGQRMIPLQRVGVYVPGGKASYPSSILMNALPAVSAGVQDIVVTTPARHDGTLPDSILRAARLCGITEMIAVGGAAAIAALALGTETIRPVDKIVGPGNRFVNEAKRQLWGRVGLDGYAGPSEVCVLADDSANATFAAADLLTQIEHSEDNAAFLVVLSEAKLDEILHEAERLLVGSQRETTMRAALANESFAIVVSNKEEAVEVIDLIAPEHLTLMTRDAGLVGQIQNAGCILIGNNTPQSAADWVLGPSHTLPTSRAARFGSPVNVLDFLKVQSVSQIGHEQLESLNEAIQSLGELEGFEMHAKAAALRFPGS